MLTGADVVAGFAPAGAMIDDPIRKGAFKTDIMTGFFRLDPLVTEDFLTLGLKFLIER